MDNIEKLINTLKENLPKAILISKPDEDAVGTGIAFYNIARKFNKKIELICLFSNATLSKFSYIPGFKKFKLISPKKINLNKYDWIYLLDADEFDTVFPEDFRKKISKYHNFIEIKNKIINIDHHASNTNFGILNFVDPKASSTSNIIDNIFKEKIKYDKETASAMLAGILGDTDRYFNSNTNFEDFQLTANLIKNNADYHYLIDNIFKSRDLDYIESNLKVLDTLKTKKINTLTIAYVIARPEFFNGKIPSRNDIQFSYETLRIIKNSTIIIVFKPREAKFTDVSFRSRNGFNLTPLLKNLGGGGHPQAGATLINENLEDTIEIVFKTLKDFIR